jgi:hypothetical protein
MITGTGGVLAPIVELLSDDCSTAIIDLSVFSISSSIVASIAPESSDFGTMVDEDEVDSLLSAS